MTLTEIHKLPPEKNGKFLREIGFKASYQQLSTLLGFEPSGPNSKEYDQQHESGAIFGFKSEDGREAWIWLDDQVPLGLPDSIHSWAASGDTTLLSDILPVKLVTSKNPYYGEDKEYSTEN